MSSRSMKLISRSSLGEFELAVGALVFVAEAAGDLVIAFPGRRP